MLRKTKEERYQYWTGNELSKTSEEEFKKIERILLGKKEELEDLKYEIALIEADRLATYKTNVSYIIPDFIKNAMTWHNALKSGTINGEKLDRRKNYDEKDSYNFLLAWMKKYIGCDLEITGFLIFGLKHSAYEIEFTAFGEKWQLKIPVVKNVSLRDLDDYGSNAFKLTIRHIDGCSYSYVCSTFEEDKLAELFDNAKNNFIKGE